MGHIDGNTQLAPTQIRAIEILLNKSLPNLSDVRMDMTGNSVTFNLNLADPGEK